MSGTNRKDETGNRYGMLTVSGFSGYSPRGRFAMWDCLCDCGKTTKVRGISLRQRLTKSCGCYNKKRSSEFHTLPNSQSLYNRSYKQHLSNAKRREIENYLSLNDYMDIINRPCKYCSEFSERHDPVNSNVIKANSVDRNNNERYYKLENCVSLCFDCQRMKGDLTEEYFVSKVNKIVSKLRGEV